MSEMSQDDFVFESPPDLISAEAVQALLETPAATFTAEDGTRTATEPDVAPGEELAFSPDDELIAAAARARDEYDPPFVGLDGVDGAGHRQEGEF